jgi:hypothetical protein
MPLQKLSRADVAALHDRGGSKGRAGNTESIQFLKTLSIGEGGKAVVATEGVSRQSVKNRLNAAAKATGVSITYHRTGAEEVVFEVVEAGSAPRRRGRKPKAEAGDGAS